MTTVLLVDHAPFFGGSESFLLDLVSALDRTAFTPVIVTDPRSPLLDQLRASGVTVVTTPLPRINGTPAFAWRLWRSGRALARIARETGANVIHTFTARTHLIGVIASLLSRVPLVWRLGDETLPRWALMSFGRIPARVVGVSMWIAEQYPGFHMHGLVPDGARPSLVMSKRDARDELGLEQDVPLVVHVGRLVRWKGQRVFLRALAEVSREFPDVQGLVVGSWNAVDDFPGEFGGGEPYYAELRQLVIDLGLNTPTRARVTFAGFIRSAGLAYAAADVFTHTSTRPEPFGRTIIEAMMAGCPVVAARAGGPAEIIVDGESGLLTTPGDVSALAQSIASMLRSESERRRLSAGGRARARAEYTLDRMTRQMEDTYRGALSS
ncbi:glycosyltransferase family 4 protein [soil metagenome]